MSFDDEHPNAPEWLKDNPIDESEKFARENIDADPDAPKWIKSEKWKEESEKKKKVVSILTKALEQGTEDDATSIPKGKLTKVAKEMNAKMEE